MRQKKSFLLVNFHSTWKCCVIYAVGDKGLVVSSSCEPCELQCQLIRQEVLTGEIVAQLVQSNQKSLNWI